MSDITQIPRRSSRYYPVQTQTRPQALPAKREGRAHWLLAFGFGMSLVVIALYLIQFVVLPPFHRLYNRVQYGAYPVYHLSADLGRGGKSDVFSFGVQGSAVVIIVTGDKTEVCQVSLPGVNASSVVLVSVLDVNGDGRQDILLHVDGTDTSAVLFGTGKSFRDRP